MTADQIFKLLKKWEWGTLNKIYGYGHNSIIGFITYSWIKESPNNCVLDGAPSPHKGHKIKPNRYADALLCINNNPKIAVEIETNVSSYENKFETLEFYNSMVDEDFLFSLFYLGNLSNTKSIGKHQWERIKIKAIESKSAFAIVSAEKEKIHMNLNDKLSLFNQSNYSRWKITKVDCWIKDSNGKQIGKNLWNSSSKVGRK